MKYYNIFLHSIARITRTYPGPFCCSLWYRPGARFTLRFCCFRLGNVKYYNIFLHSIARITRTYPGPFCCSLWYRPETPAWSAHLAHVCCQFGLTFLKQVSAHVYHVGPRLVPDLCLYIGLDHNFVSFLVKLGQRPGSKIGLPVEPNLGRAFV